MKLEANLIIVCCAVFAAANGEIVPSVSRLASQAVRAELGEFPCFALIKNNGRVWCGGALISRTHVLTAAHCVSRFISKPDTIGRITVEVGNVNVDSGETHMVRRVSQHRYFNWTSRLPLIDPNDVAVITLKTPVTESPGVKPISLPSPLQETPVLTKTFICGFGSIENGQPTQTFLQKAEMVIVSPEECENYYKAISKKMILPSQLCANGGFGHGTCKGDSGGPLTYNNQIIGIVSAGDGYCSSGSPDIYTKVSNFIPYIQSEMEYDFKSEDGSTKLAIGIDIE